MSARYPFTPINNGKESYNAYYSILKMIFYEDRYYIPSSSNGSKH